MFSNIFRFTFFSASTPPIRCGVSASLSQCSTGEQRTKCLVRGGVEGFRLSASGSGNPSKSSSSWPLATFSHPLDASFSPCTCSPYLLGQSLSEAHGVVRHLERSDHANGIFSALWIVASRTPTGCPNTGIKGGRRALGLLALQLSHSKYLNSGLLFKALTVRVFCLSIQIIFVSHWNHAFSYFLLFCFFVN